MAFNYSQTIERMKLASALKKDADIAKALDISPQALSNAKKKGELPSDLVLKFATIFNLSLDWLLTGEGSMRRGTLSEMPSIELAKDPALAEIITILKQDAPEAKIYILNILRGRMAIIENVRSLMRINRDEK